MSEQRFLVTARKYRPKLFHELVAQEHVTETLKNALRLDRLAHAYLFSGPRGVGKTTAARVLAKAIICTTPLEERADNAEPCRQCNNCLSFEDGSIIGMGGVFEVDAASNNSVDYVRELRDKVVSPPPKNLRKKIYIIDEVHMLSNAAFNALLKTLEEPPPHLLFIFATTEPGKVLPTILSRCQRFDFRRIPVPEIVARLKEICAEESVTADEESLMLIARKGDGALRDALSAFDQAVSLCGTDLRYADLAEALRVVDVDLFFEVTRHATDHSSAGMLRLVDGIVRAGYDLQEFLVGLAEHLRNLLVARTTGETALIEAAEATRRRYAEAAGPFTEPDLLRLLMLVDEAEESIKSSTQPRMKLEMALLKMAALSHTADLRQALAQIDRLEAMVRAGKLPAAPVPSPSPDAQTTRREVHEPAPALPAQESSPQPPSPANDTAPSAAGNTPPVSDETPAQATPPPAFDAVEFDAVEPDAEEEIAEKPEVAPQAEAEEAEPRPPTPPDPRPEPREPASSAPSKDATTSPTYPSLFGTPALKQNPRPAGGEDADPQALLAAAADPSPSLRVATAPTVEVDRMAAAWPRYVEAVKAERIHVGALLQHTTPVDVTGDAVVIGVPDDFHCRLLSSQHAFLLKHLQAFAPDEVHHLTFTVQEHLEATAPQTTSPEIDPQEYMQRKRQENPVIRAIFDQFGGELVW